MGRYEYRKQDGSQNQVGDSLQRVVFGIFALGHRMRFTAKDAIEVIPYNLYHFFGGGNILLPFPGGSWKNERDHLVNVLRQVNGNQSEASRLLGVSRVTIWKRIKKYGTNLNSDLRE